MGKSVTRSLKVRLSADSNGLKSGLQKAQGQIKQFTRAIGGVQSLFAGAFAGIATSEIVELGKQLVDNAVKLDQLGKKADIVFGQYAEEVKEMAESTANSLGLSESAFISATAASADLLVPIGFTRREASRMSIEITKLAGAFSEWSNGQFTAAETSSFMTKALLGETEQMKSVGIKIDQTSKAFNKRIKETMELENVTLQQAKALEILNQITSQSADAQTAFANNSDSLVRSISELNAITDDWKDSATAEFIPVLTNIAKEINLVITAIENLDGSFAGTAINLYTDYLNLLFDALTFINFPLQGFNLIWDQLVSKGQAIKDQANDIRDYAGALDDARNALGVTDLNTVIDNDVSKFGEGPAEVIKTINKEAQKLHDTYKKLVAQQNLVLDVTLGSSVGGEGFGWPFGQNKSGISDIVDPDLFLEETEEIADTYSGTLDRMTSDAESWADSMGAAMESGMEAIVIAAAEGLGQLVSGEIGFGQFFKKILGAFGAFVAQMGKMMIAYGVSMKAFKEAFKKPAVAIAAGFALVAIGTAISSFAARGPSVGGGGGGGSASASGVAGREFSVLAQQPLLIQIQGQTHGEAIRYTGQKAKDNRVIITGGDG